eukprot:3506664-Rhodomonas_salina.3
MQLSGTVTASRARCTLKSETPSSSSCNHLLSTPALSGQQRSRHEVDGLIWVAVRASMRSNVMPRSRHAYSGPSPLSVGPGPGHRLGKQAHVGEPASCRSLADFVLVLFAQDRCCLADDEDVPKQQSAGWKSQLGQCALTFGTAVRSGFLALGVGPHGARQVNSAPALCPDGAPAFYDGKQQFIHVPVPASQRIARQPSPSFDLVVLDLIAQLQFCSCSLAASSNWLKL